MSKHVLYLGAGQRQLWTKSERGWIRSEERPRGHVWVVADYPEEGIAEIKAPRLFGSDRAAFLDRQLRTRFPETPYRCCLVPAQGDDWLGHLVPTRHLLIGIDAAARLNDELDAEPLSCAGVWPTSMLLAAVGRQRRFPPDLFVVFPGDGVLRIVFLRNRSPVLTRLTVTPHVAKEQVEEIVRTLRYLENTQAVPRDGRRYGVLLLGDSVAWGESLAAAGLDLLDHPYQTTTDWRFPLFDQVLASPPGQVAPVERRTAFLANRIGRAAAVVAGVLLLAAGLRTTHHATAIVHDLGERQHIQAELQQLGAQSAALDVAIRKFDVSPETMRKAVAVEEEEIASLPSMAAHWRQLAALLAVDPELRLRELHWKVLAAGATPCGAELDPSEPPTGRQIELQFDLGIPAHYGPRERAQAIRRVTQGLTAFEGAKVIQDAAKTLAGGSLRGGLLDNSGEKRWWCVALPGSAVVAKATERAQ